MEIQLPTQKVKPTRIDPGVLILYGAPKVGKTSVLSQLPNCLIVDCEHGTEFIESLSVRAQNYDELEAIAQELKKNPYQYDYIAIDTITAVEDWAEILGTKNYKEGNIGKNFTGDSVLLLPNGAGYLYLRLAFQQLVGLFSGTTKHLILVAHLREKFLTKESVEVAYKDLELTGKIRSIIASKADAIGYMYREKGLAGELRVSFQTLEQVACGSRCEHIKGQDFKFDWKKIYSQGNF